MKIPKLSKRSVFALKKASPTVLTVVGAVGLITTTVLAVKATPKAMERIKADSRKNHDGDPYAATKIEAVKSCWRCYIPVAASGAATLICIFGANILNKRQQASITAAYAFVNRQFSDYKRKLKELYGEEAHKNIMESLGVEKTKHMSYCGPSCFSSGCMDFEDADEKPQLFYDAFSERYFEATLSQVLLSEYHTNRNFALGGGYIDVNSFYEFLGLEPLPELKDFVWDANDDIMWIDFEHTKAMVDDGLNGEIPCYVIQMVFTPTTEPPE